MPRYGYTALKEAVDKGHTEVAAQLRAAGALSNDVPDLGEKLRRAAEDGNSELVRQIVVDGGDVNELSLAGRSALMSASMNGRIKVVEVLLECSAEVSIVDKGGNTALMEAAEKGHVEVAARLAGAGAPAPADWTPLMLAVVTGDVAGIDSLVEAAVSIGAEKESINAETNEGRTALFLAYRGKQFDVIDRLRAAGAAYSAFEIAILGQRLWYAAGANDVETVEKMLAARAEVNWEYEKYVGQNKQPPLATKNLLEVTDGLRRPPPLPF